MEKLPFWKLHAKTRLYPTNEKSTYPGACMVVEGAMEDKMSFKRSYFHVVPN
jgi:hypothetical protein